MLKITAVIVTLMLGAVSFAGSAEADRRGGGRGWAGHGGWSGGSWNRGSSSASVKWYRNRGYRGANYRHSGHREAGYRYRGYRYPAYRHAGARYPHHYRYRYPYYPYGGVVAAGAFGVAAGALFGAAVAPGYYADYYYADGSGDEDWIAYCSAKYRSFNPRTGMYLGYDGEYHRCRVD